MREVFAKQLWPVDLLNCRPTVVVPQNLLEGRPAKRQFPRPVLTKTDAMSIACPRKRRRLHVSSCLFSTYHKQSTPQVEGISDRQFLIDRFAAALTCNRQLSHPAARAP